MVGFRKSSVGKYLLVSIVCIALGLAPLASTAEAVELETARHDSNALLRGDRMSLHESGTAKHRLLSLDSRRRGRAAVIVFQQDEADLISDWILYHSKIFGFANIYVIDHNSTSLPVVHYLSFAETLGVTVIRFDGKFIMKHQVLTETMHEILNGRLDVDFVIPLDVDEFIVARDVDAPDGQTFTTSPSMITHHLGALPRDGFKYKFGAIQAAACRVDDVSLEEPRQRRVQTALYFAKPTFHERHKTFYGRQGFISTDQGNHVGNVENDVLCERLADLKRRSDNFEDHVNDDGIASTFAFASDGMECFHKTPLAIVHYGIYALSYAMWQRKMYRGALAYGFSDTAECGSGLGSSYCKSVNKMHDDPEGTRIALERSHCDGDRHYSTFVSAALVGVTRSIDFASAPKLVLD